MITSPSQMNPDYIRVVAAEAARNSSRYAECQKTADMLSLLCINVATLQIVNL